MFYKNLIKVMILSLLLIISLGVVCGQDNATASFDDVQNQIDDESEDTICVSGTYSGDTEIVIDRDITIEGDAVFDGKNSTRIFHTADVTACFKNITFKNGNAENLGILEKGGAVSGESFLIFENCIFINNRAYQGGAVYNLGDTCFINCTFINNHARSGGAVFSEYYDEIDMWREDTVYGDLAVENCKFINNSASYGAGAIYAVITLYEYATDDMMYGDCMIQNTEFIQNTAGFASGVFMISDCEILNCKFENNSAKGYYASSGDVYIATEGHASAVMITSTSAYLESTTFTNNTGEYSAISVLEGECEIKDCTFKNNTYGAMFISDEGTVNIKNKRYTNAFLKDNLVKVEPYVLKTGAITTSYNSGKTLKITLMNSFTSKGIADSSIKVKVYTGKKYKIYDVETDKNGIATFKASKIDFGKHNVEIITDDFYKKTVKTTIKITKAKTVVKAPKVTSKYKKSKYFKVTVKSNKKVVSGLLLKVKVGKKTFKIKTGKNGVAKLNTKSLKVGTYKVSISSANNNYYVKAKSTIKIKW